MKQRVIYQRKRPGASRWFNKWVQSPRWFAGFWIAVAACLVVYALNAVFGRVHPGSAWGLGYGIVATVVFVGVFFYGVKRRTMQWRRLGRAWSYLQFHVYGGTVFLLLVFMHVGFGAPQGILTWWLWFLSIWVVLSGLLGIALQKWIPTLLTSGLSIEVHYDRIPELVGEIRERAEHLVTGCAPSTRDFYRKTMAPALAAPQTHLIYYLDITGGIRSRIEQFAYLRALLPAEEKQKLDTLQDLYRTKLEIDAHYTLQKALRGWLYLHVPVSIVVLVLLALHVFAVVYY